MANTANRVALITGANKGLGLEIARQLGKAGVTVVVGARDEAKGKTAADSLENGRSGRAFRETRSHECRRRCRPARLF